jgi:tetratricopeptide (TPR) repeat protein
MVSFDAGLAAARDLRAQRLLTGSFQSVAAGFTLALRVVDTATGAVWREHEERGTTLADLSSAVTTLCERLAIELEGAPAVDAGRPRTALPVTHVEEAYRAYVEALLAESRGGREGLLLAERSLETAVHADPSFARAYLRLALLAHGRRRAGDESADPGPAVRAARVLEGRLPEWERLLVRGLGLLVLDGEPDQALDQWSRLLRLYPAYAQREGVPTLLAYTQALMGHWDDLILTAEPLADAPGLAGRERAQLCVLLCRALARHGEFDRAIAYGVRAVDLWPVREGPAYLEVRTGLGRVLVDAGQRERALEVFRAVAVDPRADAATITDAAWGLYLAGERGQAAAVVKQALQLDSACGKAYHLRGWLSLVAGDLSDAASDFREAYERTPVGLGTAETGVIKGDLEALYYEGVAHQKAGRPQEAAVAWKAVVTECRDAARRAVSPVVRWQADVLAALAEARLGHPTALPDRLDDDDARSALAEARIHAVQGGRREALDRLREALVVGAGDLQQVRDDPDLDAVRTTPEFVQLLQTARR